MAEPDLIGNLCGHLFATLLGGTMTAATEETPSHARPFGGGAWWVRRPRRRKPEVEDDDEELVALAVALLL